MDIKKQVKPATNAIQSPVQSSTVTSLLCSRCGLETILQHLRFDEIGFSKCQECRWNDSERKEMPAKAGAVQLGLELAQGVG